MSLQEILNCTRNNNTSLPKGVEKEGKKSSILIQKNILTNI